MCEFLVSIVFDTDLPRLPWVYIVSSDGRQLRCGHAVTQARAAVMAGREVATLLAHQDALDGAADWLKCQAFFLHGAEYAAERFDVR